MRFKTLLHNKNNSAKTIGLNNQLFLTGSKKEVIVIPDKETKMFESIDIKSPNLNEEQSFLNESPMGNGTNSVSDSFQYKIDKSSQF